MSNDGGSWIGELSDSAWETISEHKGAIGVFGGFFWMGVFAIHEGNKGVPLLPYLAVAAVFFIAPRPSEPCCLIDLKDRNWSIHPDNLHALRAGRQSLIVG